MTTPTPNADWFATYDWLLSSIPAALPQSGAWLGVVGVFRAVMSGVRNAPPGSCLTEAIVEEALDGLCHDAIVEVRSRDGERQWRLVVTPDTLKLAAIDEIVTAWERATPSTPIATRDALVAIADVLHGRAPTTVAIRERYCLDAARATIEAVRDLVGAGATEATTEAVERVIVAASQVDR